MSLERPSRVGALRVDNGLEQYWLAEGGIYKLSVKFRYQIIFMICGVAAVCVALGIVTAFELTAWYFFWLIDIPLGTVLIMPLFRRQNEWMRKARSLSPEAALSRADERIEWSLVEKITLYPGYRIKAALAASDYGFAGTRSLGRLAPADLQSLKELVSSKTGREVVVDERIFLGF